MCRLRIAGRRGLGGKCKTIAFLESGDVFKNLLAGIADFQQIAFEQRDSIRQEFGERAMEVFAERSVRGVLKNVRELSSNFREARETVAGGSAAKRMSGNVEMLEVFAARGNLLQYTDVFPQVLQVFGSFLEEHF